ncbi:MAG: (d)CMP kinase [Patescibacteria group bacterium]
MNYRQVLKAIKDRDTKDARLEKINRAKLLALGLKLYRPRRVLAIDTGKVEGVDRAVGQIKSKLKKSDCVITLEGISGSGKSATAERLAERIKAVRFSFGELFRYLTYLKLADPKAAWPVVFKKLRYRFSGGQLNLWDGRINVSRTLVSELRQPEIETSVPRIAEDTQKPALELFAREIFKLGQSGRKIVIEGRAFTLDFLPADVRIKLRCDARIRASRRLKQASI